MNGLANVHLDAVEHGDTIAFMHAVQEGCGQPILRPAGGCRLAWGAESVIHQARHKLHELESATRWPPAKAVRLR